MGKLLQKAGIRVLEGRAKEEHELMGLHVCVHAHVFRVWVCAFISMHGRTSRREEERKEGEEYCQRAGALRLRDAILYYEL